MTSNVGSAYLARQKDQQPLGFSASENKDEFDEKAAKAKVMEEVRRVFRPEFLNRIDEMVVFHSLSTNELGQIVDILLKDVNDRAKETGLSIEIKEKGKEAILKSGQDKRYGARPLKRAIQRLVEDELADLFLRGEAKEGDTVLVDSPDGEKVVVSKKEEGVAVSG